MADITDKVAREGAAQFDLDAAHGKLADLREAELQVRREPLGLEGQAVGLHVFHDVVEVLLHEVGQQEAIMQLGAPAHQALGRVGGLPEACQQATQQELLGQGLAKQRCMFADKCRKVAPFTN